MSRSSKDILEDLMDALIDAEIIIGSEAYRMMCIVRDKMAEIDKLAAELKEDAR